MIYRNMLQLIGKTPLVELGRSAAHVPARVFAKIEAMNPGQSAKDRIALHIIEKAERTGKLKPGGTIIDATSGNTGFSLAMVAAVKGYRCVLAVTDKASDDKINNLRALGAEVIVCSAKAKAADPNSYYETAKRLVREIEGSFYVNQNFNPENSEAHYLTTGPEILEVLPQVDWLIAATSTGGTLSGTARCLKEANPAMKVIGVDAYGSVLKKYHETGVFDEREIYSYNIEGTGKNIIPANMDFGLIDRFVKSTDQNAALRARELAQLEGILAGYSSGACLDVLDQLAHEMKPDENVVLIFSDHGSKYVSKIFNDNWMLAQGFLPAETTVGAA